MFFSYPERDPPPGPASSLRPSPRKMIYANRSVFRGAVKTLTGNNQWRYSGKSGVQHVRSKGRRILGYPQKHSFPVPVIVWNTRALSRGPGNIAKPDRTGSRRRIPLYSGLDSRVFEFYSLRDPAVEGNEVQPGLERAPAYQARQGAPQSCTLRKHMVDLETD